MKKLLLTIASLISLNAYSQSFAVSTIDGLSIYTKANITSKKVKNEYKVEQNLYKNWFAEIKEELNGFYRIQLENTSKAYIEIEKCQKLEVEDTITNFFNKKYSYQEKLDDGKILNYSAKFLKQDGNRYVVLFERIGESAFKEEISCYIKDKEFLITEKNIIDEGHKTIYEEKAFFSNGKFWLENTPFEIE